MKKPTWRRPKIISIDMGKKKSLADVDQKIGSTNVNQKKL